MGKYYGDIPRGIFVIRGENVILLGEIVSELCLTEINLRRPVSLSLLSFDWNE